MVTDVLIAVYDFLVIFHSDICKTSYLVINWLFKEEKGGEYC